MQKQMKQILPIIKEMNLIAEELSRKIVFSLKVAYDEDEKIRVLVTNSENGSQYSWDIEKTNNRYYMLKDLVEEFQQTGALSVIMKDPKTDPFWDPADPYLIGKTQLKISPVLYNRCNPVELWIFEEKTEVLKGLIKVNVIPTDLEDNNLENSNPIKDP